MAELVLASTSPYRRALLERLGLPFRARDPAIDEDLYKQHGQSPRALADLLAQRKAESVRSTEPSAIVLGSDQVAALDELILGKPGSEESAIEQLTRLSGRTHELVTAVAIWTGAGFRTFTDVTRLRMRPLNRQEIDRYVAADRPFDCAGAYKIESRGISLFEKIESDDHTAIMGLPLIAVCTMLRELGFAIP